MPGGECLADSNQAPAAPAFIGPSENIQTLTPEQTVFTLSPFEDPDPEDVHAATELEIWLAPSGALVARVWQAVVEDPAKLTRASLDDGQFEGTATALEPWTRYAVRARFLDSNGTCSSAGEWSEPLLFRTDDGSAIFFDPATVFEFELELSPETLAAIDAEARPPGCVPFVRDSHPGTLRFQGQEFQNVGVRSKGGCGSARRISGKTAFKVNLSWDDPNVPGCPEERRLHGLERFTFNNMVQDRSFIHESLAYDLYKRMGVPTPRTAYTRLLVNGELWGLYRHVESLDRRFASRWFGSKDGMLYEGTYRCDLIPANIPPDTDGVYCFSRKFGTGQCSNPTDFVLLADLINTLDQVPAGQFYPEVEQYFEYDRFLAMWAVNSVIGHWDGYEQRIINNYRVYYDETVGRWTVIPTGVDQTYQTSPPFEVDPFNVSGILASRCLQEPDCEAAFAAKLRETLAVFEAIDHTQTVQQLRDLIITHVMEDPRKEFDFSQWQGHVDDTLQFIANRPARIRQYLSDRGL